MSKRRSSGNFKVGGKSWESIINTDFNTLNSLNEKELRSATSRLVSAANKRIRRLKESSRFQYTRIKNYPKEFSIQGKNYNEVKRTFFQIKDFMEKKTSSISGIRQMERELDEAFVERFGIKGLSHEQKETFWTAYRSAAEEYGGIIADQSNKTFTSKQVQNYTAAVFKKNKNLSTEEFTSLVTKGIKEANEAGITLEQAIEKIEQGAKTTIT